MPELRSAALGAALCLALLAPSTARAQQTKSQCIADNETGQDLRTARKLRAARVKLAECESPTCPAALRQDCARRVDEIDQAMPSIVFEAKDPAGNDVADVRVTIDGEPLADRLDGRAIAVDPGEHTFAFEVPGASAVTKTLVINEGEKERHELVSLAAPQSDAASGAERPGHTQRLVGLAVGGAGVAGIIVGSIFGLVAKSTYDGAVSQCPGGNTGGPCGSAGHDQSDAALTQALVSTIAFAAGGVLLVGGAALYLTAPKQQSVAVTVAPNPGGASLGLLGRF